MNFLKLAALAICAATASAQRIDIGYPQDGASIAPGSNLVVEVDRPNSLSASTEVSIVVALASCATSGCRAASEQLGTVLYNGGYNPQYHPEAGYQKPPHQNFSVIVPSGTSTGLAKLNIVHVALIGAGQTPFMETKNITVKVN